jgi:hypothetical protein
LSVSLVAKEHVDESGVIQRCCKDGASAPSCVSRESNDGSESHERVSGVLVVDKKSTREASAQRTKRPLIFP